MKFIFNLIGLSLLPASLLAQEEPVGAVAGESAKNLSLWDLLQLGGWAMFPLAVLSIIAVMLLLIFLVSMRRGAVLSRSYMNTADVLLKKGDLPGLLSISSRHSEMVARVMQRTLDFAIKNPRASVESLREIAETEAASRAAAIQHRVVYLADVGVLAPMVGLFGTVVGITKSFGVMGSEASQAPRAILLASGVSDALVATGSGLIIGIIAMGFYALFRNKAQRLISDLDIATTHLMSLLALGHAPPGTRDRRERTASFDDEEY